MKHAPLAIAALQFLFLVPALAQDPKAEIQEAVTRLTVAVGAGDAEAVRKEVAPDFEFIDTLGEKGGVPQWLAHTAGLFPGGRDIAAQTSILEFRPKGDSSIVISQTKVTGTAPDFDGMEGPMNVGLTHRGTWTKGASGWKLKQLKEVMIDGTINKKLVRFKGTEAVENVKKSLGPVYMAMGDVYSKKDWNAIYQGMPEEFKAIDADGNVINREELIERVKNGAKDMSDPVATVSVQNVAGESDKVRVVRVFRLLADYKLPDGKSARARYVQVARDLWIKAGPNWTCTQSEELYSEAYLNGVRVPLGAIGGK